MKGWESPERQEFTTRNNRLSYTWQPVLSIDQVPEKLRDLITSDEKLKIFELISFHTGTFTAKDLWKKLQEQGFNTKLSTIQVLLRGLSYRHYLQQFEHKIGTNRGRSTVHFTKVLIACILFWMSTAVNGQTITTPNPSLPTIKVQGPVIPNPQYNLYNSPQGINQANLRIVEEDMRNYQLQEQRRQAEIREAYKALGIDESESSNTTKAKVSYSFSKNTSYGQTHFNRAFDEISKMADGQVPYNLKRAVFLTEFAYDTTLNYQQFERQISKLASVIMLEMKQQKISPDDNLGKIMAAFKFMADTLRVRNPATEKVITTYPKLYDFEDFYGMRDYSKMFVSKLIRTGRGQCHSLPLLFLILCQEINAKAYLSFAPEHCYVKFEDKNGNLQNIELTNQMFTTDQFILQSGYITSAAIKSKIYMDTLSMSRIINYTLNDLANNYVKKYGYDDFVLRCATRAATNDPKSIHAYMHLANYYNILGHNIEGQYKSLNVPQGYYFQTDEELRRIITQAVKYGKLIDDLGYAQMPPDMYSNWLNSLKNESMKQQHLERKRVLNTMMEN